MKISLNIVNKLKCLFGYHHFIYFECDVVACENTITFGTGKLEMKRCVNCKKEFFV